MYDFQESHDTRASIEAVWAIYTQVTGWSRWLPHLTAVQFSGPFESGAAGYATVQVGLSQDIPFHLEKVEPFKGFDVVWTIGHLLNTRMMHTLERVNGGTRITHAYHTGGVMAPFNFLQAAAAHERVQPAMAEIARLAGG